MYQARTRICGCLKLSHILTQQNRFVASNPSDSFYYLSFYNKLRVKFTITPQSYPQDVFPHNSGFLVKTH